jgi:hypothetical protein
MILRKKIIKLEKFALGERDLLQSWAKNNFFGLFFLNLIIMVLILLHTAGYFDPFFLLSINSIFFISFILCIFFLRLKSQHFFVFSLLFLVLSGLLKLLGIGIWAERAAIYSFQAFFLGVLLTLGSNPK